MSFKLNQSHREIWRLLVQNPSGAHSFYVLQTDQIHREYIYFMSSKLTQFQRGIWRLLVQNPSGAHSFYVLQTEPNPSGAHSFCVLQTDPNPSGDWEITSAESIGSKLILCPPNWTKSIGSTLIFPPNWPKSIRGCSRPWAWVIYRPYMVYTRLGGRHILGLRGAGGGWGLVFRKLAFWWQGHGRPQGIWGFLVQNPSGAHSFYVLQTEPNPSGAHSLCVLQTDPNPSGDLEITSAKSIGSTFILCPPNTTKSTRGFEDF